MPLETNVHIGRMSDKSIMFAPIIFPTERLDSFFLIAVIVVTSSGSDVPIATIVTAITLSGTPRAVAIAEPPSIKKLEPSTIPAAPTTNNTIFLMISFLVTISFSSAFFCDFADKTLITINMMKTIIRTVPAQGASVPLSDPI